MSHLLPPLLTLLLLALTVNLPLISSPLWVGTSSALLMLALSGMFALEANTWYALIAMTIYIGGLLVMFAYFSACHPNTQIIPWPSPLQLLTFLISSFISINFLLPQPHTTPSPNPIPPYTALFSLQELPTILLLGTILFIVLVIVVKLSHRQEGPLRPWK